MKLFSAQNKPFIIELALALMIILGLVFSFENSEVVSPDGVLYHELAHNLVDGDGYIDNVRNDFIIPPVGHPLVILLANTLGVNNPLVFGRILLFLGLLLAFLTVKELKLPLFYRLLVIPIVYAIIPVIFAWGVEISIFFSINLMLFCFIRFMYRYSALTALFLGLSIALNLLIRPVYAPFIYLTALSAIVLLIKFKRKAISLLISLAVPIIVVNTVMLISTSSFRDKRLSAGTYSEIPLYCANNPYIDLNQVYYSGRWTEESVSEEDYAKGVAPLQIKTTWKDRADTLRAEVISFYKNHPGKAISAIYWRALRFTLKQPGWLGIILFVVWFLLSGFLLYVRRKTLMIANKENSMYWLGAALPIYTIAILSLFVYVGDRYNLTSNLIFVFGILLYIPMLRDFLKERAK